MSLTIFFKIGALRNFAKFTRKHLCRSLSFKKVAGLQLATLLKKKTLSQVFYYEIICEIMRGTLFMEHLQTTPSDLNAIEFNRESVFNRMLVKTIEKVLKLSR